MPFAVDTPAQVRLKIRQGQIQGPTAGLCPGYAQANLVVLPQALAYDFLLFAQRNPRACPLLEVSDTGSRLLTDIAPGADIATDLPKYRVYEHGAMVCERTDVSSLWRDDLVSFLIGCSFSFEADLLEAGIPVRHIEEGRNVPMYITNIPCAPAGTFHGNMVVSMRPMSYSDAIRSIQITGRHAPGARRARTLWRPGGHRHTRHRPAGFWRRGDHPPRRNSGVLALRRNAASGADAIEARVCHHARARPYADYGREKHLPEILTGGGHHAQN